MSSRSESATPSNYQQIIQSSKTSRQINIILCCVGILIAGAAIIVSPADYRLFAISCAVLISIGLLIVLFKNLKEARAVGRITKSSMYAAMLTKEQQHTAKKYLIKRGQSLYFATFLFCVAPESVILSALYYTTQNKAYLLFMAVFAALALTCVVISSMFLAVRLSPIPSTITISEQGILFGREVIPFDASSGDALQLLRFRNYYYLRFVRQTLLGIRYVSEIIFPTGGALRTGLKAPADEEIVKAMSLSDLYVTEDEFYESRSYLEEETDKKPVKQTKEHRAKRSSMHPDERLDGSLHQTSPARSSSETRAPAPDLPPASERRTPDHDATPATTNHYAAAEEKDVQRSERMPVPAGYAPKELEPSSSVTNRPPHEPQTSEHNQVQLTRARTIYRESDTGELLRQRKGNLE